jgi:hypothetical protein
MRIAATRAANGINATEALFGVARGFAEEGARRPCRRITAQTSSLTTRLMGEAGQFLAQWSTVSAE